MCNAIALAQRRGCQFWVLILVTFNEPLSADKRL